MGKPKTLKAMLEKFPVKDLKEKHANMSKEQLCGLIVQEENKKRRHKGFQVFVFPCFLAAAFSSSVATLIAVVANYSQVFGYIQRDFGQGDFSVTSTTWKAEWACQGSERSVRFIQGVKGELSAFSLLLAAASPGSEKALVLHMWEEVSC